jgi:MinD-like ATPase involved in chromosome partitioning or flagellar assembly
MAALATGTHTIAVIGPKGGVGKSTTALVAGLVLAQVPLARPILVELNPDWGTLDELLGIANPRTIADLLGDYTAVDRTGIGLLQGYVTMFGRLPVLTAPSDPDAMARLSPRDYDRVLRLLALHYNVILLDCGTAFTQRLNQFAIQRADHLIVVGWPEQATMRKTLAAVDYLASARYERDYRGVLAEIASADGQGDVRARALADVTLACNGIGYTGGADPIDPTKVRTAAANLSGVVELPYAPALRALLADGTLTIDALPPGYRRATKALLVAALGGLVQRSPHAPETGGAVAVNPIN